MPPRLTSFAPQFLVDDLARSVAHYRGVLGGYILAFGGTTAGGHATTAQGGTS